MKEYYNSECESILSTFNGIFIDYFPKGENIIDILCYESEDEATLNFNLNYNRNKDNKFRANLLNQYNDDTKIQKQKKEKIKREKKKKVKKEKIAKQNKIKPKKEKKERKKIDILGKILSFSSILSKIIFVIVFVLMIFVIVKYGITNKNTQSNTKQQNIKQEVNKDKNKENKDENKDEKKDENIEEKSTPTLAPVKSNYSDFKQSMIDYAINLNAIVEGEKECINKLSNNMISTADAAAYFDKTQQKKQTLLDSFYVENIETEHYHAQNKLKEIYIYSINLSKQIKVRYNNSEKKENMVSDWNSFIKKHEQRIADYEEELGQLKK